MSIEVTYEPSEHLPIGFYESRGDNMKTIYGVQFGEAEADEDDDTPGDDSDIFGDR